MKHSPKLILALALGLTVSGTLPAQTPNPSSAPTQPAQSSEVAAAAQVNAPSYPAVDKMVQDAMEQLHLPSVSVAVTRFGETRYNKAYGFADVDAKTPATPNTLYRIASVSNSITATAAMKLFELKKLDIDAPVQRYCKLFPSKPHLVTMHELLAHRGGIHMFRSEKQARNTEHYDSVGAATRAIAGDDLSYEPDTKFQFSSYGYVIAGCAIEGASHQTYTNYVRESIFTPAKMQHTAVDDPSGKMENLARFYNPWKDGKFIAAPYFDSSDRLPAGGWVSTAEDIARFGNAVADHTLLTEPSLRIMWTQIAPPTSEGGWGLGWYVDTLNHERRVGHEGGQVGASAYLMVLPMQRISVAVLANVEKAELKPLAEKIALEVLRQDEASAQ